MKLNYIITGTGRSGTVFMARFLTSIGIACTHEAVFTLDGLVYAKEIMSGSREPVLSWVSRSKFDKGVSFETECWLDDFGAVEAESSYMAAPYLDIDEIRDASVIHVVRNPIKVVNSFCHYLNYFVSSNTVNGYEEFVYTHLPELKKDMTQYDRTCLYWVLWNEMVERHRPDYFFRVEDDVADLMNWLGKTGDHFSDNTINSYKRPTQGRFDIGGIKSKEISDRFVNLGKKYGYPMKSEYLMI